MTDHHRIPSKLRPGLFISSFSRLKDTAKLLTWRENLIVLPSLCLMTWSYRLSRFFKTVTVEVLEKKLFLLTN